MKNMLASAFLALAVSGVAGHAASFPQAALDGAPMSHSVSRAPAEAQALRASFPALAPVGRDAPGAHRSSRDVQAAGIEFPGAAAAPVHTAPAVAVGQVTLETNRFQSISLR